MLFYLLNKQNYNIALPKKVTLNSDNFSNVNSKNIYAVFHATTFQFPLMARYKKKRRPKSDKRNTGLLISFVFVYRFTAAFRRDSAGYNRTASAFHDRSADPMNPTNRHSWRFRNVLFLRFLRRPCRNTSYRSVRL
jgi:hypothetical protein